MMYNIYLLKYNNYFNRMVKKKDTIEEYIQAATKISEPLDCINFNPNDGISTSHTINWSEDWTPDYFLVVSKDNKVKTRWFVTEWVYISGGDSGLFQYRAQLRRDLLAEYYDSVMYSPCYIEKGYLDANSPLLYNKENFAANQIKVDEKPLTDYSRSSWLCIYFDPSKKSQLQGSVTLPSDDYIQLNTTLQNWDVYKSVYDGKYKDMTSKSLVTKFLVEGGSLNYIDYESDLYEAEAVYLPTPIGTVSTTFRYINTANRERWEDEGVLEAATSSVESINPLTATAKSQMSSIYADGAIKNIVLDLEKVYVDIPTLLTYNNKIVRTTDSKFYKVRVVPQITRTESTLVDNDNFSTLYNALYSRYGSTVFANHGSVLGYYWPNALKKSVSYVRRYMEYRVYFDLVDNAGITVNYNFSDARDLYDQPFAMIALPYSCTYANIPYIDWQNQARLNSEASLAIVRDICQKGVSTTGLIYDIQLLPYCPMDNMYCWSNIGYDFDDFTEGVEYRYAKANIDGNTVAVTFAIYPTKSTRTFISRDNTTIAPAIIITDAKAQNQYDFCRLISPNFAGMYEFIPARNQGVDAWKIDVNFQPINPYIHVAPVFKGLYGQDYNDPRGLICQGDFSIATLTSAWEQYELQNKNYQAIFNRQIQNLDTNYEIDREGRRDRALLTAAGGSVGLIGSIATGNALGAVGSAALIGKGLIGSSIDQHIANQKYAEQRDYMIDEHNYQLDNIKALPASLAKLNSLTVNNKIFVTLEYYTCTDEEKVLFAEKLKLTGSTVGADGKLINYVNPDTNERTFVKGQIYYFDEDFEGDNHEAKETANEVAQGFYVSLSDIS